MDKLMTTAPITISLAPNKNIPVHVYGNGPNLLIAFHGYDYDGQVFQTWAEELGEHYTICAPDLPFHGQAEWDEKAFTPSHIVQIIRAIAENQKQDRFTLAGHSMGARLLVCTASELASSVDRYILLAPAGIGSFDRVLPLWAQRVLEFALSWPKWLELGVNIGYRLGWVNNFRRRYAEVQLYPADKRNRLFRVYNSLVQLQTSRRDRVQHWQQNPVDTLVVLAEDDRFVPNAKIRAYFAKVPKVSWREVRGNHDLVNKLTAAVVRDAIQKS